jgi:hypothetical protein
LLVGTGVKARKKALDKENLQGLKDILDDLLDDADYWGVNSRGSYFAIFSTRKLTADKMRRLMVIKWTKRLGYASLIHFRKSELMKRVKESNAVKLQK